MTESKTYPISPDLIDAGLSKSSDFVISVKRDGQWLETEAEQFREQIREFAAGLHELGIRHGDRVALHAENSTEWLIVDQAVLRLGAVTVPIYTTQPPDQVSYILNNAGARVYAVSTQELYDGVKGHVESAKELVATIGLRGTFSSGMKSYEETLALGRSRLSIDPDLIDSATKGVRPENLATLSYTSGTTGVPKGVMLTHANIASNIIGTADRLPFTPPGRMLSYLPLSHSLERMAAFMYMYLGCSVYFVENHLEIVEDVKTVRPLHMTSVPRLLEKIHAAVANRAASAEGLSGVLMRWAMNLANHYDVMKKHPGLQHLLADRLVFSKLRTKVFGGNLEAITSGGAALSPNTMSFFNAIGIYCGQGYGLTETSPVVSLSKRGDLRPGSVGSVLDDVEVRIAEDGEILTRGPNIMQGYYQMPEQTAEVIGEDGWFHTGDIGHLEDGHLYITDRKKQLFKLSTGKYIAPTPIEIALCDSPVIEQAVVIGSERKFCGALLVPDPAGLKQELGHAASDDDAVFSLIDGIVQEVNTQLPSWEQVKKFRVLSTPFSIETGELTPTMKVKRRVIREKYAREIESLYD